MGSEMKMKEQLSLLLLKRINLPTLETSMNSIGEMKLISSLRQSNPAIFLV